MFDFVRFQRFNFVDPRPEIAPKETDTKANLAAIGKRIKDTQRRIERVQLAIETSGGELRPLVDRMDELERERLTPEGERIRLEAN